MKGEDFKVRPLLPLSCPSGSWENNPGRAHDERVHSRTRVAWTPRGRTARAICPDRPLCPREAFLLPGARVAESGQPQTARVPAPGCCRMQLTWAQLGRTGS